MRAIPHVQMRSRIPAVLGGLIWSWTVVLTALRPAGVPGAHRSTLDLHPTILGAFVLMALAATALSRSVRNRTAARVSTSILWLGVATFSINVVFVLLTGDDAPVWPTHYLGILLVALGTAMLGVAMLRTAILPKAIAAVQILAVLTLPFSQMQDARVLLWLPLGIAWLAVGLVPHKGPAPRA